jgi:hypothetical protein
MRCRWQDSPHKELLSLDLLDLMAHRCGSLMPASEEESGLAEGVAWVRREIQESSAVKGRAAR